MGKLFIINQKVYPTFGRDWIKEIKPDWADISEAESSQIYSLLDELQDIFETDIGENPEYKDKFPLQEGSKRIYFEPRPDTLCYEWENWDGNWAYRKFK